MSGVVACPACGADNLLSEGKTSMFCAYCGKSIEKIVSNTLDGKRKLNKSEIIDGELAYKDRNIENLDEIIELYSDSELKKIKRLDVSKNKIKSLKGISRFRLEYFDISDNDLRVIDELPDFDYWIQPITILGEATKLITHSSGARFSFCNNKNLEDITDNVIQKLNQYRDIKSISLKLWGCDKFNFGRLCKINFSEIVRAERDKITRDFPYRSVQILRDSQNNALPIPLKEMGFVIDEKGNWEFNNQKREASTGCFIATATMGSYDHPTVMELRNFRDNWILKQAWGEAFVKWYYYYGAKAAKVIKKSFILRNFSYLFIVKPLVFFSRVFTARLY